MEHTKIGTNEILAAIWTVAAVTAEHDGFFSFATIFYILAASYAMQVVLLYYTRTKHKSYLED